MMMIEEVGDTDQEAEAQGIGQDQGVLMKGSAQGLGAHMKGKGQEVGVADHTQDRDLGHTTEEDQGQEVAPHHIHLLVKRPQPKVGQGHLREIDPHDFPPKNKIILLLVKKDLQLYSIVRANNKEVLDDTSKIISVA